MKMPKKATINDLQNYLSKLNWKIDRTTENRVYKMTNLDNKEVYYMRFYVRYDQVIDEMTSNGIDSFIHLNRYYGSHKVADVNPTRTARTPRLTKREIMIDEQKANEVRRQKNFDVIKEEAASETPANVPQADAYSNVVEMSNFVSEKIDWTKQAPEYNDGYYFPDDTSAIARRLQMGRNIFISGAAGTGKTEFVVNLARYFGIKVVRVNFSVGTTEAHLIGKYVVKNGSTDFIPGVVPRAMMNGWWILFDEIDYAQPEHLSILQPVLEGDALILTQDKNQTIIPHENFRVFATANTKGRGDVSQSYVGTNFLNMAFIDRWSIFEFEYTKHEKKILGDIITQDKKLVEQVYSFFGALRKSVDKCDIVNTAFSTRRMIHMAEMLAVGEPLDLVLRYEIYNRYDKSEVDILQEIAYDTWDKIHYFGGWKAGDSHKD
jgi:cobaltochelatase CobS